MPGHGFDPDIADLIDGLAPAAPGEAVEPAGQMEDWLADLARRPRGLYDRRSLIPLDEPDTPPENPDAA